MQNRMKGSSQENEYLTPKKFKKIRRIGFKEIPEAIEPEPDRWRVSSSQEHEYLQVIPKSERQREVTFRKETTQPRYKKKSSQTSSRHGSASKASSCSPDRENDVRQSAAERWEETPTPLTDRFGFFQSDASTTIPLDAKKIRSRETKWIQMLDNWGYFMDEKFEIIKRRCRKGIPSSLRGRAWKYLCGATFQMEVSSNRFVFDYCVKQVGDPKCLEDIEKDLNRQFPEHEMFARTGRYGNNGKNDLFNLLKAWTVLHPEEGYCQGQAPIAAVLLMHMPVRDAFYCFVQICHKYLPGYYSSGLEAVQIDGDILTRLLRERCKRTYRHFKQNQVDPALYMIEWFMCVFCRTLPWPTVLRVWDMFLCEGVKVLFKLALVLLKNGIGTEAQIQQFPDMPAIVTRLRNLPPEIMTEEFVCQKIAEVNLDDVEMEKMHHSCMRTRQMRFS